MSEDFYVALHIKADPNTEDVCDLVADDLAQLGFDSFVLTEGGLTAYCPAALYSRDAVENALENFLMPVSFTFEEEKVERENWNKVWEEESFKPIVIGEECVVHGRSHTGLPQARYDIEINPRMAFGSGSHQTTQMILSMLLKMDLEGKGVIDMGTGTGILAILCRMKGASPVTGIEIDAGTYENAIENAAANGVDVRFILGDASALREVAPADLFVANINRNIILNDLDAYRAALKSGGLMILSGFYEGDVEKILSAARKRGLDLDALTTSSEGWCALRLCESKK